MSTIEPFDCREAFRRIHDYVDRELAADEIQKVRAHLGVCAVCAREFRFEEQVIEDLRGKLRRMSAPADLIATVMSRLPSSPPRSET